MMRVLHTSPLLLTVMMLLSGCASGRRGDPQPPLPAAWSVPACYVADASAPAADTLYVVHAPEAPLADGAAPPDTAAVTEPRAELIERAVARDCAAFAGEPATSRLPVVVPLAVPAGTDLRDALDLGVVSANGGRVMPDVVVTRDPDVIAYAGRRGFLTSALGWGRTYVLASRASASVEPTTAERHALSRDAVTVDSRGAAEPFGWRTDTTCLLRRAPAAAAAPSLIAYAEYDKTARQLAERVVSLARMQAPPKWVEAALSPLDDLAALRVVSMPADSIARALESGEVAAAILSTPRDPRTRCGTRDNAPVPAGAMPLVDTRAHVIIRRGSGAAIIATPDGALHVVRPRAP